MRKQAVRQAFEDKSVEVALDALGKSIARWTDKPDRTMTAIPGLSLFRRDEPTPPMSGMYEPSICLIAQGAKRVLNGQELAVDGIDYQLVRSESVVPSDTAFDQVEATTALACASGTVKNPVQLKREIGKLWEDLTKAPYKELFNASVPVYPIFWGQPFL